MVQVQKCRGSFPGRKKGISQGGHLSIDKGKRWNGRARVFLGSVQLWGSTRRDYSISEFAFLIKSAGSSRAFKTSSSRHCSSRF